MGNCCGGGDHDRYESGGDFRPQERQVMFDTTAVAQAEAGKTKLVGSAVDLERIAGSWETVQDIPAFHKEVHEALKRKVKPRDPKRLLGLRETDPDLPVCRLKIKEDYFYEGNCLNGVPHGWGFMLTKGGEYFEGQFVDGCLVKNIRNIDIQGTIYDGEYKRGRNGRGVLYKTDGTIEKCQKWELGIPQVPFVIENSEGKVIFRGFKDAKSRKQGRCLLGEKDFNVEATFKDDILVGPAALLYPDQSRYDGAVDANYLPEGQGIRIFADGRKFAGPFSKGKPHGQGMFTPSGGGEGVKQVWADGRRV